MGKRVATKARNVRTAPEGRSKAPEELKSKWGLSRWAKVASGVGALILFLTIYLLRLDKVVGMIVDDAWYVLLAKGLAIGKGYTLINSPSPGIVPFYPPAFPMLLSLVYRLSPDFPSNVWLLKSISIAAMLGVGLVAFYYFFRDRRLPFYLALGIAVATIFYPALVFLATSTVMSECVFTLVLLSTIVVIDQVVRVEPRSHAWRYALLGGALASVAFLTRSVALALIIAAMLYLLKERLIRAAVIFGAVVVLFVAPWMLYAGRHAPTAEQRVEQSGNIVQSYAAQFWQKKAGQPMLGTITIDDLPERVWTNGSEIIRYDLGSIAFYPLFRPPEPGLAMRIDKEARGLSLVLSLLALIGWVSLIRERMTVAEITVPLSLLITVAWGWEQFRLLLPLVPFLIFYLLMGIRVIYRLYHRLYGVSKPQAEWALLTIIVWSMGVVSVYNNLSYILKKHVPTPDYSLLWTPAFEENEAVMRYVHATLPKSEVIATQNPALLHLYTGHQTIASDDPAGSWETWNRLGVRYLVRTSAYRLPDPDAAESQYKIIYRSNGILNLRVIDLGLPGSRPVWGAVKAPALSKQ